MAMFDSTAGLSGESASARSHAACASAGRLVSAMATPCSESGRQSFGAAACARASGSSA